MKATRTCSMEDCTRKVVARGWCTMHYSRWQNTGTPHRHVRQPIDRFRALHAVDQETGCWNWTGYRRPDYEYGTFLADGKLYRAHRWSYEYFVGPIPDGLVLDHLCRNPPCVNPDHLEPVTTRTNTIERGMGQRAITYREGRCKRDHELTDDNVYSPPNNPAVRQCIKCRRIRTQQRGKRLAR